MVNERRRTTVLPRTMAVLIFAAGSLALTSCSEGVRSAAPVQGEPEVTGAGGEAGMVPAEPASDAPRLATIVVAFKLDPRLTGPGNLGDRWVAPANFSPAVPPSGTCTVEARAYAVDTASNRIAIRPKWTPQDPNKIKVEPGEDHQVTMTFLAAGRSPLTVVGAGLTKTLTVRAEPYRETLKVTIYQ